MRRVPVLGLVAVITVLALTATACGGEGDASTPGEAAEGGPVVASTVLEALDGGELSLADYRGRPLVVNFFANWCAPCVIEMPEFEKVHQQLGDEVAFLGISVQETVEQARALVEQTGVTYDVAREPQGDLLRELGGVGMPTTVFIDAGGRVVDSHTGQLSAGELTELIESNLASS